MFVKKLASTIVRESENCTIVVNILNGEECALNDTGVIFMQVLNSNQVYDTSILASDLATSFEELPAEELHLDLVEFYKEMKERGFVDISETRDVIDTYLLEGLHIDITMKCNERCLHCYIPDSTKDKVESISFKQFCKLVDEFTTLGGKGLYISGGEPLLHPSIMEMLTYIDSKGLKISLFSNLLLLNNEHVDLLSSINVQVVQTSVYSLDPTIHDRITRRPGSLSKTLKSVERLLHARIPMQISCPVMSLNRESIPELMRYCKDRSIRLRTNSLIVPQEDGLLYREGISKLTLKQNECMLCEMMELDSKYVIDNLIQSSNRIEHFYTNPKEFLVSSICNAGIDHLCIVPNGDVYPCPGWKSYLLGNINEMSLFEIWTQSKPLQTLRHINCQRNFKECLECKALNFCKRCFVDVEQENGGELLRINPRVCREAFAIKEIVEKYS